MIYTYELVEGDVPEGTFINGWYPNSQGPIYKLSGVDTYSTKDFLIQHGWEASDRSSKPKSFTKNIG